jgi:hypothetical protein
MAMSAQERYFRAGRGAASALLAALLVLSPLQGAAQDRGTVLREGVPETYTVVRGDTLWDIAGRFLQNPWQWPEIWEVNPGIENPHLIYPGDIINLVWVDGSPRLRVQRGVAPPPRRDPRAERLEPRIRVIPHEVAIPTIPLEVIRPFLSRPRVLAPGELDNAPYILRSVDGRLMAGENNRVYVRGLSADPETEWTIVRQGQEYIDPQTEESLGFEAEHVAEATVVRLGDPATVRIISSRREAMEGDHLIRLPSQQTETSLHPRAPDHAIDGQIVAMLGGGMQIGQYSVVAINRGESHGLEPGMVLSIWLQGEEIEDTVRNRRGEKVQLPDERVGEMIVFRTFGMLSYALVMRAERDMSPGDIVRNP